MPQPILVHKCFAATFEAYQVGKDLDWPVRNDEDIYLKLVSEHPSTRVINAWFGTSSATPPVHAANAAAAAIRPEFFLGNFTQPVNFLYNNYDWIWTMRQTSTWTNTLHYMEEVNIFKVQPPQNMDYLVNDPDTAIPASDARFTSCGALQLLQQSVYAGQDNLPPTLWKIMEHTVDDPAGECNDLDALKATLGGHHHGQHGGR